MSTIASVSFKLRNIYCTCSLAWSFCVFFRLSPEWVDLGNVYFAMVVNFDPFAAEMSESWFIIDFITFLLY